MKSNVKLSIIVPIRNGEKYLDSCIESIINQTYKDFELILVNNGSEDDSENIIKKFKEKDQRVLAINTEGKRVNEVRKIGLENALGDYVGFVDCDDTIEIDMYKDLLTFAIENQLEMVSSGMIREFVTEGRMERFDDTLPEGVYDKEGLRKNIYPYMLYRSPFYTHGIQPSIWNKIYKRSLLMDIYDDLDTSIIFGEDATVVYAALLKSKRVGLIRKGYYHYKIHQASNTLTPQVEFLENSYRLHNQLKKFFENDVQRDELLYQLKYFTISTAFFNLDRLFGINIYRMGEWYMPYGNLLEGKDVVLWGAGDVGVDFYRQLRCNDKIRSLIWVDINIEKQNGIICSPTVLASKNVDVVIIAVIDERVKEEIEKDIQKRISSPSMIFWAKYEKKNLL